MRSRIKGFAQKKVTLPPGRHKIVILDEATASIDHETSLEIQAILRDEMRESTVITIAHRLEAIKDVDYYVVLDQGRVAEQGFAREE